MKKYFIEISAEERKLLTEFVEKQRKVNRRLIYARILLASGGGKTDREIANALDIKKATVATARKRFAAEGIRFALENPTTTGQITLSPAGWLRVTFVLVGLGFCIPALISGPIELASSLLWASFTKSKVNNLWPALLWTAYLVVFVLAIYLWVKWKNRPKKVTDKPSLAPVIMDSRGFPPPGEVFPESRSFPESFAEVTGFPPPPESAAEITGFPPPPNPAQNIAENDRLT